MGFLSSLFGGGGSDVKAPTLDQLRPNSARTDGLLYNTSYNKDGVTNVTLSPDGSDIRNRFLGIADNTRDQYNEFSPVTFADERLKLMRNRLNRDDLLATNRLMATQAATGGGVGVTSGQRQQNALFAGERELNRDTNYLNLLNAGDAQQQQLFGNQNAALGNYQNFLGGGENVANRDQAGYFNQAAIMANQANQQYQADLASQEAEGSFFGKILGTAVNLGMAYYTGGGSLGGSLGASSAAGAGFSGLGSLGATKGAFGFAQGGNPLSNNNLFGKFAGLNG